MEDQAKRTTTRTCMESQFDYFHTFRDIAISSVTCQIDTQSHRSDGRATGANWSKTAPTSVGTSLRQRPGTPSTGSSLGPKASLWKIFVSPFSKGSISHNDAIGSLLQSYIPYIYSLFHLRYIISVLEKNSFAFQKGHLWSPDPPNERQEGRLPPSVPSPSQIIGVRANIWLEEWSWRGKTCMCHIFGRSKTLFFDFVNLKLKYSVKG